VKVFALTFMDHAVDPNAHRREHTCLNNV